MVVSPSCYFLEVVCGQGRVGQNLCILVDNADSSKLQWSLIDLVTSKVDYPRWHGYTFSPMPGSEFKLGIRCPNDEIVWEILERNRRWPDVADSHPRVAHLKMFFGIPGCVFVDDPANTSVRVASLLTAEKVAWDKVTIAQVAFQEAVNEREIVESVMKDLMVQEKAMFLKVREDWKIAQAAAFKQVKAKVLVTESPSRPCSKAAVTPQQHGNPQDSRVEIETPEKTRDIAACQDVDQETHGGNLAFRCEQSLEHAWLQHALRSVPTFLCQEDLSQALHSTRQRLDKECCACITAWRSHLSTLVENFEQDSLALGVPAWAVVIVAKARLRAIEAASLLELLDMYQKDVRIAKDTGVAILKTPLLNIIERCDWQSRCLREYTLPLQVARVAFDSPSDAAKSIAAQWDGIENNLPKVKQREWLLPTRLQHLPFSALATSDTCFLNVFRFAIDATLDLVEAICVSIMPDQKESRHWTD